MKKILVTGAAGFIGSSLCEFLIAKGFRIVGLDNFDSFYDKTIKEKNLRELSKNSSFQFIEGNVGDIDTFQSIDSIDFVIHLAAKAGVRPSIQSPESYIENNINQTNLLLQWMAKNNIDKLIFASSSSVYGNNTKVPFSESDFVDFPISPYAFTKKSGELLCHTYHSLYGIDVVNLRFFTVFGERQRPDLAIYKFAKSILSKKPITLFGDGTTSRDYTYILDILNGIYSTINYLKNNSCVFETINLGSNAPITLIQLVHTLEKIIGEDAIIIWNEMQPGDVNRTFANINKAQKLLGYNPNFDLETALIRFVDWIKKEL